MTSDVLATVLLFAILIFFTIKYKLLYRLIFKKHRVLIKFTITLNLIICLIGVHFSQAAHSILSNKRCYDESHQSPIGIDDWRTLLHFQFDSDTRFLILPSAIIIFAAITAFRRYLILQIVGTGLNVWTVSGVIFYFQSRAWCLFDPHGYEEEGMVLGYVLVALASLVLMVVFGTFLMLDRGQRKSATLP